MYQLVEMAQSFNGIYILDVLVINEWVFEKRKDSRFICSRSSGVSDYIAEWWHIDEKYQLKYIAYEAVNVLKSGPLIREVYQIHDVLKYGTLLYEVDQIHDVLTYCCTHIHPDFVN